MKVYTVSIRTMDTSEPLCVIRDREKAQQIADEYKKYCDQLLKDKKLKILRDGFAWVTVDEIDMIDKGDEQVLLCGRKIIIRENKPRT